MDRVAIGKTGKQTVCPKGRQAGEKASGQEGRQIYIWAGGHASRQVARDVNTNRQTDSETDG